MQRLFLERFVPEVIFRTKVGPKSTKRYQKSMKNLLWMPSCIQKTFLTQFLHFWSFFGGPRASPNDPQNAEKRKNVDPKIMLKIMRDRICVFHLVFFVFRFQNWAKIDHFLKFVWKRQFYEKRCFLFKIKVFHGPSPPDSMQNRLEHAIEKHNAKK